MKLNALVLVLLYNLCIKTNAAANINSDQVSQAILLPHFSEVLDQTGLLASYATTKLHHAERLIIEGLNP